MSWLSYILCFRRRWTLWGLSIFFAGVHTANATFTLPQFIPVHQISNQILNGGNPSQINWTLASASTTGIIGGYSSIDDLVDDLVRLVLEHGTDTTDTSAQDEKLLAALLPDDGASTLLTPKKPIGASGKKESDGTLLSLTNQPAFYYTNPNGSFAAISATNPAKEPCKTGQCEEEVKKFKKAKSYFGVGPTSSQKPAKASLEVIERLQSSGIYNPAKSTAAAGVNVVARLRSFHGGRYEADTEPSGEIPSAQAWSSPSSRRATKTPQFNPAPSLGNVSSARHLSGSGASISVASTGSTRVGAPSEKDIAALIEEFKIGPEGWFPKEMLDSNGNPTGLWIRGSLFKPYNESDKDDPDNVIQFMLTKEPAPGSPFYGKGFEIGKTYTIEKKRSCDENYCSMNSIVGKYNETFDIIQRLYSTKGVVSDSEIASLTSELSPGEDDLIDFISNRFRGIDNFLKYSALHEGKLRNIEKVAAKGKTGFRIRPTPEQHFPLSTPVTKWEDHQEVAEDPPIKHAK